MFLSASWALLSLFEKYSKNIIIGYDCFIVSLFRLLYCASEWLRGDEQMEKKKKEKNNKL
jgi:hypothetical protein